MAVIKCKMCGGDLSLLEDASIAECEFCGSVQTVPKVDDEKKLTLFARANLLRIACEFDKAAGIYESIVADFQEEAEAYWGLVLCKFGIEYVDDPLSGKKIPTCHRSGFDSVLKDSDFEQAQENADPAARRVYREEAKTIEELRKGIIAVSSNEEPYDIFICYKETAEDGQRTLDSVLAQDVYDALTDKGYRVFFSRITLEDKLGMEYEPYIFAALNSAKIMLAFGTDYEYFNAVWVKNEWSRFLKLMAKDKEKHLIPCFKGIDAYDMPKEFARLQAQDLGKVGAIQDLMRGIEKLLPKLVAEPHSSMVSQQQPMTAGVDTLLRRVFMFLEDQNWQMADEYAEKVLDIDPENGKAYLGKLLGQMQITKPELLQQSTIPFHGNSNYIKTIRYGDDELAEMVQKAASMVKDKNETYLRLVEAEKNAKLRKDFVELAEQFQTLSGYKDADRLVKECLEKAEICRKNGIYNQAIKLMKTGKRDSCEEAKQLFSQIPGWKDANLMVKRLEWQNNESLMIPKEDRKALDQERQRKWRMQGLCQHCGGEFKYKLFDVRCSQCGIKKDY